MCFSAAIYFTTYFRLHVYGYCFHTAPGFSAVTLERYYAHAAEQDEYGVIAPWYKGLNGQCDLRVRIAAETLKRYPWIDADRAVKAAPYWLYTSHWNVDSLGTISGIRADKWLYGDFGPADDQSDEGYDKLLPVYRRSRRVFIRDHAGRIFIRIWFNR